MSTENQTHKAANDLKERLRELSRKNLIDTAAEHWAEAREIRKRQHNPIRGR